MRNILFISHTPTATTGYGRVTRRLAHALRQTGHDLAVVGSGFGGGPHELPYPIIPWPNLSAEVIVQAIPTFHPDGPKVRRTTPASAFALRPSADRIL